jgi:hypothetical protein
VSWTVRNDFGPVAVHGVGGPLGSSLSQRPTIAEKKTQAYQVVVPAGASRLDASIGKPSDAGADLDLVVLKDGVVVAISADGDSEEAVSVSDPVPGTYQVLVDGFAIPSGSTQFDYLDVFYSSALGSLQIPKTVVSLPTGGSTTVTGSVVASQPAAAGRQLFGEMRVVTDRGAVIGRGPVKITEVTS